MKRLTMLILIMLSVMGSIFASGSLVVYFSATGNTEQVARLIANAADADIYEIVPAEPYTAADLDYGNRNSRTSEERYDSTIRPAIASERIDLSEYDTIYIGYPIWWADMPRILYTFFDEYDLSGKVIAPFCTSGGSGLSSTRRTIERLEPAAEVTEGLSITTSRLRRAQASVDSWLEDIR